MNPILPQSFDNRFAGSKASLVILGMVAALKAFQSFSSIFDTRHIAVAADGIPLDSYPAAASQQIMSIFAKLGNLHAIIVALCVLTLVRYRSMTPLMFVILIYEYVTRRLISEEFIGTPLLQSPSGIPGWVVQGMFVAMLVGLGLSFWSPRSARPSSPRAGADHR